MLYHLIQFFISFNPPCLNWLGWYLNFSVWFMKSVLFEPEKKVIK